jgi:Ca2+-binding RTX toxin-like protein
MIRIMISRLVIILLVILTTSTVFAFAANIAVPITRLTNQTRAITANALKPTECAALNLTSIVVCLGGNCDGANGSVNELILGTSNGERIRGRGGTDCILGGGGNDTLVGNAGADVCIGGPGNDDFQNCQTRFQ